MRILVDRTTPLRGSVLSILIIKRHTPKQAGLCVRGPSASSFESNASVLELSEVARAKGGLSGFAARISYGSIHGGELEIWVESTGTT